MESNNNRDVPIVPEFIIIDDDHVNNKICTKIIELNIANSHVATFTNVPQALAYLKDGHEADAGKTSIVFLDIVMSPVSGWKTLDQFSQFPDHIRERVKIYILLSSLAPEYRERASEYPFLSGFISKPLSRTKLRMILPDLITDATGTDENN